MQVIGIDLGGTKVVAAHFSENGEMTGTRSALLEGRTGTHVAALIADLCSALLEDLNLDMQEEKCIGICVPGIANSKTNRIWAPNIPGWENFRGGGQAHARTEGGRAGQGAALGA